MDELAPVYDALRKADAAGNADDAKKLSDYIRSKSTPAGRKDGYSDIPGSEAPKGQTFEQKLAGQSMGEKIGGVVEAGRTMVQNAVPGFVHELATDPNAKPDDPKNIVTRASEALMHTPQNPRAQGILEDLAKHAQNSGIEGLNPIGAEAVMAGHTAEMAGHAIAPVLGAVKQEAGFVKGAIHDALPEAAQAALKPKVPTAAETLQQQSAKSAQNSGYVLPPSQAKPNTINSVLEGFSGKIKTAQEASIKNEAVTDGLVRKGLGLTEDAPLNRETMLDVRKHAGQAYKALEAHPQPFRATIEYHKAIDNLGDVTERLAKKFPDLFDNRDLKVLKNSLKVDSLSGEEVVELTKALRNKADDLFSPMASGADKAMSRAYRQASNAIENMTETNLEMSGNKQLLSDFQNARQVIAKSYSVEKALTNNGHVDARKLALQLKRNRPLSGELKEAAQFAGDFPKAAQTSEQIGSVPKISPLDAAAALMTPHGAAGAAAMLLGRPIARAAILSKKGQSILTGSKGAVAKAPKPVPKVTPAATRVGARLLKDHESSDNQKTGTDE